MNPVFNVLEEVFGKVGTTCVDKTEAGHYGIGARNGRNKLVSFKKNRHSHEYISKAKCKQEKNLEKP